MSVKPQIVAGFMPLLDSAVLVAAKEKGFADAEGFDLALVRETSWANIRDRMAVGHFQVAHVLAPMPIASNLGLTPLAVPTIAPMALGLGGNAVTVSNELWARMAEHGAVADFDPGARGARLESGRGRPCRAVRAGAALCGGASLLGPQLRASLLACCMRHRSGPRRRHRHRAAAPHGGCACQAAPSMAIAWASRGTLQRRCCGAAISSP